MTEDGYFQSLPNTTRKSLSNRYDPSFSWLSNAKSIRDLLRARCLRLIVVNHQRLRVVEAVGIARLHRIAQFLDALGRSVPAPVMPLPLRTTTLPVRFAFFCVPSSFVLECVWPLPVVASTVFDISSTMSSSVAEGPG